MKVDGYRMVDWLKRQVKKVCMKVGLCYKDALS